MIDKRLEGVLCPVNGSPDAALEGLSYGLAQRPDVRDHLTNCIGRAIRQGAEEITNTAEEIRHTFFEGTAD